MESIPDQTQLTTGNFNGLTPWKQLKISLLAGDFDTVKQIQKERHYSAERIIKHANLFGTNVNTVMDIIVNYCPRPDYGSYIYACVRGSVPIMKLLIESYPLEKIKHSFPEKQEPTLEKYQDIRTKSQFYILAIRHSIVPNFSLVMYMRYQVGIIWTTKYVLWHVSITDAYTFIRMLEEYASTIEYSDKLMNQLHIAKAQRKGMKHCDKEKVKLADPIYVHYDIFRMKERLKKKIEQDINIIRDPYSFQHKLQRGEEKYNK